MGMDENKVTGLRIRSRRDELGLSQNDVADLVGVTKAAVSAWEVGQENRDTTSARTRKAVAGVTSKTDRVLVRMRSRGNQTK
jgi:DNA-binding transcriptional regulator YiaG